MRSLPSFALHRADSLQQATQLLQRLPDARLLAGGTDLLPNLRRGLGKPRALVDLGGVAEMRDLQLDADGGLCLGAGVTLARLATDPGLAAAWPALAEAAASVAASGHRSAATVGGNLCQDTRCVFYNQGEWWRAANGYCLKYGGTRCHVAPQGGRCHGAFCSDLAPVLLAARAEVTLCGAGGERRIPLEALYRDDGAAHLAIGATEVLAQVHLGALPPGVQLAFGKLRSRGGIDFPLAAMALAVRVDQGRIAQLRVGLSGTNSMPVVLSGTEELAGMDLPDATAALRRLVQKQASPMRSSAVPAHQRRDAAAALAARLLRQCME